MMENFVPLSVEEQQRIAADMAAFHAMCLSRDRTPEHNISELERAQPAAMRQYFRQRLRYWQHLYRDAFSLSQ
ncbi:DNA polymerase III subunit theta [Enterobacter sp. DTU_2021_1002640_1_SI_PRY_ASU_LCPMC_013]|uniref:DNA polymerase III subunit theta n=1 Tax=Enterobacter sp. DTU_2021_1002640_1_SI_PRY_ASU_LCPMC_013 TaxID=3077940 RepID=UPI0028EBF2BA|nr:DNA polymerase III subunit theta [Enterobacter sp. DTU_2021_1002640_1_SI_PRY_ASU_LCPMC_013]WNU99044.1 DNA polymerase III subunit theta [Enterobacter sp. DTU_2021_1002640_1_SI_PRY_ASU_LCPMC_013]